MAKKLIKGIVSTTKKGDAPITKIVGNKLYLDMDGTTYLRTVERLPLKLKEDGGNLIIDPAFQRGKAKAHIQEIVEFFDPLGPKIFAANHRTDGTVSLIDGQQEREAMVALGFTHWFMDCTHGLSPEQESRVFKLRNKQKPIGGNDMFRADIVSNEPDAQALLDLVRSEGFDIKMKGHYLVNPGNVLPVKTVQYVYATFNGNVLRSVLKTIRGLWSVRIGANLEVKKNAKRNELLKAIGRLYGEDKLSLDSVLASMKGVGIDTVTNYVHGKAPRGAAQEKWYRYYIGNVKCGEAKIEKPQEI